MAGYIFTIIVESDTVYDRGGHKRVSVPDVGPTSTFVMSRLCAECSLQALPNNRTSKARHSRGRKLTPRHITTLSKMGCEFAESTETRNETIEVGNGMQLSM